MVIIQGWLFPLYLEDHPNKIRYMNIKLRKCTYEGWIRISVKSAPHLLYTIFWSLYSRMLHILDFLARMVETSSRCIFFFSLTWKAWYHFCSLTFPWRLNSSTYWIYNWRVLLIQQPGFNTIGTHHLLFSLLCVYYYSLRHTFGAAYFQDERTNDCWFIAAVQYM